MDHMRATKTKNRRRATVLLLVVSLLALLFVIVTGFLNLARTNRGMVADIQRSNLAEAISEDMADWGTSLIKEQVVNASGKVLAGGSGQNCSLEDIPGYRHSNYLAALEPVWDPAPFVPSALSTGSWAVLGQLRWPAVTSLDDGVTTPQPFPLFQLMRDYDFSNTGFRKTDAQWNARNPFMDADGDGVPDSHFLLCASATEAANTMAGASVQLPRYNPAGYGGGAFVPYRIPRPGFDPGGLFRGEKWQRYDEQARYEVAMRVISHGGMVTLDSPTLYSPNGATAYTPFNRDFTINMFDAVRRGGRSMSNQYQVLNEQHRLFDDLRASVGAVESSLRRRFILPAPAELDRQHQQIRRIPPILAELQGETDLHAGFPGTLVPSFRFPAPLSNPTNWQRINIGVDSRSGDERLGWALATAWNPTTYNTTGTGQSLMQTPYDRRHFITAINNSDELARKQEPNDPQPTSITRLDLGAPDDHGATYEGELKFYLGEVAKAFVEVDNAGVPQAGTGWYSYDLTRGNLIVERLARLYYDMLRSHSSAGATPDDWGDATDPNDTGSTPVREAASRRQQAMMLSVNTVAFAAPRSIDPNAPGFIPVVSYADVISGGVAYDNPLGNGTGADDIRYIGYTPQPFFTEVIAYREADADPNDPNYVSDPNDPEYDDPNAPNLVLAVELYNPNTPCYDGSTDTYGLVDVHGAWLPQFAISVNGANPGDPNDVDQCQQFGLTFGFSQRLNGRSFMRLVIENDESSHFNSLVNSNPPDFALKISLDIEDDPSNPETLTLWRWDWRDVAGNPVRVWFPVDEIEIGNSWPGTGFWRSAYRDTSPNREYAAPDYDVDGLFEYARWNVIARQRTSVPPTTTPGKPQTGSIGNSAWLLADGPKPELGVLQSPDMVGMLPVAFSPTTTLITMNAGPVVVTGAEPLHQQFSNYPMFGALDAVGRPIDPRPRSFPTVGFLLFVPRFSHMQKVIAGTDNPVIPISETLTKQWSNQGYAISNGSYVTSADYPADFGHMPVFDNTQQVPGGSYFDNTTGVGNLPWGQLVFDYFTTLDPIRDVSGDGEPDIDPLRIPGRININAAPWYVLANLPLLGPDGTNELPVRPFGTGVVPTAAEPSPAFWDPFAGMLVGWDSYGTTARLLAQDPAYTSAPLFEYSVPYAPTIGLSIGRYRLGPWLAQSAAAYRDGVQYVPNNASHLFYVYSDAQERNLGAVFMKHRADARYGTVRGQATASGASPTQFGFVSVGELLNVKGLDSSTDVDLLTPDFNGAGSADSAVARGDFVKAVSVVALLDSQYLTTRSNTFTVYTTVMDREDPQASVRSQVTVDRSNLLTRLTYAFYYYDSGTTTHYYYPLLKPYLSDPAYNSLPVVPRLLNLDGDALAIPETPVRTTNGGALPRVIAKERVGYYNARYDD